MGDGRPILRRPQCGGSRHWAKKNLSMGITKIKSINTKDTRPQKARFLLFWFVVILCLLAYFNREAFVHSHGNIIKNDEIFIESPRPSAFARTKDGGYVIAGDDSHNWAIRIDNQGNVKWKCKLPLSQIPVPLKSAYSGVAVLPDDSVILCGNREIEVGKRSNQLGLLTHLDKNGVLIDERVIYPNNESKYTLSYLDQCISREDGVTVFGVTAHADLNDYQYGWTFFVDRNGKITSERLLGPGDPRRIISMIQLSNHDLVLASRSEDLASTLLTRINVKGEIINKTIVSGIRSLIQPVVPDMVVRTLVGWNSSTRIESLSPDFNDGQIVSGKAPYQITQIDVQPRVYLLRNGSLASFGQINSGGDNIFAAIAWTNPKLGKIETMMLSPKDSADNFIDAVPTESSDEFAAIARVHPTKNLLGRDETRTGTLIFLIKIKQKEG